ncbi:hypothetical protein M782_11425 [Neisseria gonorrhoeae MU_NG17]|nr:hypothetical protein M782_11425 [Neisseria gonorrhoeae MU_NG17]
MQTPKLVRQNGRTPYRIGLKHIRDKAHPLHNRPEGYRLRQDTIRTGHNPYVSAHDDKARLAAFLLANNPVGGLSVTPFFKAAVFAFNMPSEPFSNLTVVNVLSRFLADT